MRNFRHGNARNGNRPKAGFLSIQFKMTEELAKELEELRLETNVKSLSDLKRDLFNEIEPLSSWIVHPMLPIVYIRDHDQIQLPNGLYEFRRPDVAACRLFIKGLGRELCRLPVKNVAVWADDKELPDPVWGYQIDYLLNAILSLSKTVEKRVKACPKNKIISMEMEFLSSDEKVIGRYPLYLLFEVCKTVKVTTENSEIPLEVKIVKERDGEKEFDNGCVAYRKEDGSWWLRNDIKEWPISKIEE
jgi:hypothetical protein